MFWPVREIGSTSERERDGTECPLRLAQMPSEVTWSHRRRSVGEDNMVRCWIAQRLELGPFFGGANGSIRGGAIQGPSSPAPALSCRVLPTPSGFVGDKRRLVKARLGIAVFWQRVTVAAPPQCMYYFPCHEESQKFLGCCRTGGQAAKGVRPPSIQSIRRSQRFWSTAACARWHATRPRQIRGRGGRGVSYRSCIVQYLGLRRPEEGACMWASWLAVTSWDTAAVLGRGDELTRQSGRRPLRC